MYKSNFEELEKKLFVNYNARCDDYKIFNAQNMYLKFKIILGCIGIL